MAKYRANAQDTWKTLKIKALDSMVIGSVIDFAGKEEKIPVGWLICDSSAISRTEYSELFDAIGTKWGTGDGSTTFNLPPAGIVRVGYDASDTDFDTIGKTGGYKGLQKHSHTIIATTQLMGGSGGTGTYIGTGTTYTSVTGNGAEATATNGNLQPYGTFYTIIKAKNTTPTMASIVDAYSTSTKDGYACDYVNGINTYSTNEVDTGKTWIDGKPIYRKVIDCGTMPSATTKEVDSGLTNVFITQIYGIMYNSSSTITLPDINPSGVAYSVRLYYGYSNNKIGLVTGADRSTYNGYVILEYTKTTD